MAKVDIKPVKPVIFFGKCLNHAKNMTVVFRLFRCYILHLELSGFIDFFKTFLPFGESGFFPILLVR